MNQSISSTAFVASAEIAKTTSITSDGIVKGTLYILLILFVVFINVMVILSYCIREKSKRSIPEVFILNLAVSSLLTCASVILIVAYIRMVNLEKREEDFFCKVQCFFGTLLRLTDVGTTTGVAVDRFIAVYKPITYRTRVKLKHGYVLSGILWLICITIAALPFLGIGGVDRGLLSICTANWRSEFTLIVLSVTYSQFIVVLVCYIGIFNCIKGFIGRKKAMIKSQITSYSPQITKIVETNENPRKDIVNIVKNSYVVSNEPNHLQITSSETISGTDEITVDETTFDEPNETTAEEVIQENIKKKIVTSTSHKVNRVSWLDKVKKDLVPDINELQINLKNSNIIEDELTLRVNLRKKSKRVYKVKKLKRFSAIMADRWNAVKIRKRTSNIKHIKESQRFAKVMGIIVLIFYLSWMPLAISINVVYADALSNEKEHDLLQIGYNISMFSSIGVPIAFPVMCKPYLIGYKRILSWLCRKKKCK
ncbi:octopamine receptor isoform X1 [Hydra vulgaris]|uniref:Octopamine receptor isoform X1 n=1 Tax=Hydra vulgaris TaxID=6087 RepID=A0ABM4C0Z1_HYDVU